MNGNDINFDDKKIKKSDFYKNRKAFQTDDTDVDKILVSKKEPYGTRNALKYFIGYTDNDVIRPLCARFPKITCYTNIKVYAGSIITNFHNKKIPKQETPWKCLSIIMLDSVIKANKKYYPQTLLEECKYEHKTENLIDDE